MITHNLPAESHAFVGRKEELAEIAKRLDDPHCRLLTIVGPGGIGKTRLATQVSIDLVESKTPPRPSLFQDGVFFVSLQSLIFSDFNLSVIADSFKLQFSPDSNPEEQLLGYLRSKSLLLVLDNFEHLLDGTGLISRLLAAAPRLKALVTSREALNLKEEWLYRLEGMGYPSSKTTHLVSGEYDSIAFFASHAQRIQPSFSLNQEREGVTRICQLVQGMPLALELASNWIRSLTASEIANEIEQGLDILEARASNVPARHRNMRAVFDASWNRLSSSEQEVFKTLAIFRGGFTREAAEVVAHAARLTLAELADKSWLQRDSSGRYVIHELLRQYGEEQLIQNPAVIEAAYERYCAYYSDFLAPKWKDLCGDKAKETRYAIESELENIWAFWEWAISQKQAIHIEPVLYSLWLFYDCGNRFHEGTQLFGKAAQAFRDNEKDVLYGKILMYQGALCNSSNQLAEARALLNKSIVILQDLGDDRDHAFCLTHLGVVSAGSERAMEYYHASRAIYHKVGFRDGEADALLWIGILHHFAGEMQKAKQYYEEALVVAKTCNNLLEVASVLSQLSNAAYMENALRDAIRYAEEALECFEKTGTVWGMTMSHARLAQAACGLKQYRKAERHILQALAIAQEYHLTSHIIRALTVVSQMCVAQAKTEQAVELMSLGIYTTPASFPKKEFQVLEELIPLLPPEQFEAAFERGKARNFDATVQELITEFTARVQTPMRDAANPLTKRETEVLRCIAKGYSNQAIANELILTVGSVKWYVKEIFSKLDVANRTQAVARARELNLLSN